MGRLTLSGMRVQNSKESQKKKKKGQKDQGVVVSPKEDWRKRFRNSLRGWILKRSKKTKDLMDAL